MPKKDTIKPTKFNREIYDLSCYNAVCGQIGRLQTIFTVPTYANDTISINLVGALRLSELKRYLTLDCKVDLFAFHVKHRSIFGSSWTDMIAEGIQHASTLSATYTSTVTVECLGGVPPGNMPDAYPEGYKKIWNDFFRIPNATSEWTGFSNVNAIGNLTEYGKECARLPAFWNTGIPDANIDAQDYQEVAPNVSGNIELLDIANIQAEYEDQQDLEWFSHRYRDVLAYKHGSTGISIDADERPELLMHVEQWLSGYDIDGTDIQTLGNYKGKSQGIIQMKMPPKYFNESGMIWVMILLRFPSILQEERHYLMHHSWDYETIAADPALWSIKPPIEMTEDDFHGGGGTDSWGHHPYGQWTRTQPNRVHNLFHGLEGFPFIAEDDISDSTELLYEDNVWGMGGIDFFMSEDLGHWNLVSKAEIEARRNIPQARTSIYAGAHLR
jgi:hypothetical protein